MSKLNNIIRMMFMLKTGKVISRNELSEKLEVTPKQVAVYKTALDEFFTIESIPGPHGGYKLVDAYFPFKELLSKKEVMELKMLVDKLEYESKENEKLKRLIDKINFSIERSNDEVSADIIAYSRKNPKYNNEKIELDMYMAILEQKVVIIEYQSNQNKNSKRKIEPYKHFIYRGETYIVANCLEKNGIRFFKLARIKDCIVTGRKFEKQSSLESEIKERQENGFGVFDKKEYDLELVVRPPMANSIKERIWVENQEITELDDGKIFFKAKMSGEHSIISWILTMREFVEIKNPLELKGKIIKETEKMLENYRKNL